MYGGVEEDFHKFLTLAAVDGGEWSASCPWPFALANEPPPILYLLDRRLGAPHSQCGCGSEERKIPCYSLPGNESQSSSPQPSHYTAIQM
jgi:hypothetical protein